jgi:hypothetical protein
VTDPSPPPPAWIRKHDGRLVPFDADKISRSLFAATEALGRPDAFLARELTDGVVHFLVHDGEGTVPTTAQVAELTIKVVRELGQPALAQAFAEGAAHRGVVPKRAAPDGTAPADLPAPAELVLRLPADAPLPKVLEECRRRYTLRNVFARDLAAAHGDGLLTLTGLETPYELAGCVLGETAADGPALAEALEAAAGLAGGTMALDSPEHALARKGVGPDAVSEFRRELGIGLRASGLRAIINLNSELPPSWADDLAEGPLFGGTGRSPERQPLADLADALREGLLSPDVPAGRVRIDWHLGETDFGERGGGRLVRLARAALGGAPLAFAFDRPRRPVPLAEGIDRQHPAALLTVELHLPRLAEQVRAGTGAADLFLHKLGSLARLALSAGVQKRDFLRRHSAQRPAITRGFLLDRARLVVAPVGLDTAVAALLAGTPWEGGAALDYARRVLERLRDVLKQDGAAVRLPSCLDGSRLASPEGAAGLANAKTQLRALAALHRGTDLGTGVIRLPAGQPVDGDEVADWLRWTGRHTDVARVCLARPPASARQLTVPWPEEHRTTAPRP